VWDVETEQELHSLTGHTGFVQTLAVTADGRWVISGSTDNTLKVWDIFDGNCLVTTFFEGVVLSFAYHPNSQNIVVGDNCENMYFLKLEGL